MDTLSKKLSKLCDALEHHEKHQGLDPVFFVALRGMLEECVDRARALETGLVPPVQVPFLDCHAVAGVARLHLTGRREASAADVEALACIAIVHEAATCQTAKKRESRTA